MTTTDYNLIALREACDEDMIEEIEVDQAMSKEDKVNWDHTPIKKSKVQDDHAKEDTVNAVLRAVHELTQKMDDQTYGL